jgi:hypothetical protein
VAFVIPKTVRNVSVQCPASQNPPTHAHTSSRNRKTNVGASGTDIVRRTRNRALNEINMSEANMIMKTGISLFSVLKMQVWGFS